MDLVGAGAVAGFDVVGENASKGVCRGVVVGGVNIVVAAEDIGSFGQVDMDTAVASSMKVAVEAEDLWDILHIAAAAEGRIDKFVDMAVEDVGGDNNRDRAVALVAVDSTVEQDSRILGPMVVDGTLNSKERTVFYQRDERDREQRSAELCETDLIPRVLKSAENRIEREERREFYI